MRRAWVAGALIGGVVVVGGVGIASAALSDEAEKMTASRMLNVAAKAYPSAKDPVMAWIAGCLKERGVDAVYEPVSGELRFADDRGLMSDCAAELNRLATKG